MINHPDEQEWMHFLYGECESNQSLRLQQHLAQCVLCQQKVDQWQATMSALDTWHPGDSVPSIAADAVSMVRPVQRENTVQRADTLQRADTVQRDVLVKPAKLSRSQQVVLAATGFVAVALAFIAGRWMNVTSQVDVAELRSHLSQEIRNQVAAELRTELTQMVASAVQQSPPNRTDLLPLIETESDRIMSATLAKWVRQDSGERQKLEQMLTGILENQVALRTDLENLAIEAETQILRTRRELVQFLAPQTESSRGDSPDRSPPRTSPQQF